MIKLGCNFWSYHKAFKAGKINQLEWLKLCKEKLNLDAVELLDFGFPDSVVKAKKPDMAYLKKVKRLCNDLGLEIPVVSAGNSFGCEGKALRDQIAHVKKMIDIGYYLGAPTVRYFAGWPDKKENKEKLWKNVIKASKECAAYADKKGIVFALENHNHGGFISYSKDVFRLMNGAKAKNLKLCWDTGNYADLNTSLEKTKHLIAYVHAKAYDMKGGKENKLDYEKVFRMLKSVKFNGFMSIEFEGEGDEYKNMPLVVNYLRKMIAKYSK